MLPPVRPSTTRHTHTDRPPFPSRAQTPLPSAACCGRECGCVCAQRRSATARHRSHSSRMRCAARSPAQLTNDGL
eukprot:scaffold7657_cov109-Isochrysis_galbana.AAC.1